MVVWGGGVSECLCFVRPRVSPWQKQEEISGTEDYVVMLTDLHEFLARMCAERGHTVNDIIIRKLGIDSGRGSLKASISILFDEDLEEFESIFYEFWDMHTTLHDHF